MKVPIPKRFESKTSLREFIQTREFILAMKTKMNNQIYESLNASNKMGELVSAKLQTM